MRIASNIIHLSDANSILPCLGEFSAYKDMDGNNIVIPNRLLLRIIACLEADAKQKGISFDEWSRSIVKNEEN